LAADLGGLGALPVAAEVHRRPAAHRQADHAVDLLAVADAPQVLTPSRFLSVAGQIRSGNVVVMAEFAATQAGEVGLGTVGSGTGSGFG